MSADWWRLLIPRVPWRRLATAAALPGAERWLALRAIAWLALARLALRSGGFARARRLIAGAPPLRAPGAVDAGMVSRAVERAARALPGSTCLHQAIVAARLLRTAGLPAEMTIGVARPAMAGLRTGAGDEPIVPLDAHAWTRSAGYVVVGNGDLSRFTELATFVVAP